MVKQMDTEEEDRPIPEPVGYCPKCGTPAYSHYGFCGVCHPERR